MHKTIAGKQTQNSILEKNIMQMAHQDTSGLEQFYLMTKSAVFGFALSLLKNPCDAEDVLQNTYLHAYAGAQKYKPMGKPMSWLLTITRNLSMMHLRKNSKTIDITEEEWLCMDDIKQQVNSDNLLVLQTAMHKICNEERHIIVLHAVAGLKHREIAALLDMPLSTVLSKYSRGIKKLEKLLMEE